jgi:DNA gyrase subunit A
VRTRVAEVSQLSRNTQGVTLIKLPADEKLVSVMRLDAEEDNDEESEIINAPAPVDGNDSAVEGGDSADTEPTPVED